MALRIGSGRVMIPAENAEVMQEDPAPVPAEEPMPADDLMAELPESLEEAPASGGSVSPMLVNYMDGAQRANAMCGNCKHFGDDGTCDVVAGPIDPEGICNIYEGMEQEAPMPEEPPIEEAPPAEEPAPMPEEEEASQEGY